jgi:hypothetical protein
MGHTRPIPPDPTEFTDEQIRLHAAELIRSVGPNRAAYQLGINRITALSLAAGAPVLTSTFALVREHRRRVAYRTQRAAR